MRRVFNLQRDPDSGELYAIGKSDRPYAFDEVCAFERAAATGDLRAAAALIDLDLERDRHGVPLGLDALALAKQRARAAGWPPRASAFKRKRAWEDRKSVV